MKTAGVAEVKAHLSALLQHVKGGGQVVITERGEPVARIVAIEPAERRGGRRARLAKAGLLHTAPGRLRGRLQEPPEGVSAGEAVLGALLDERENSR